MEASLYINLAMAAICLDCNAIFKINGKGLRSGSS